MTALLDLVGLTVEFPTRRGVLRALDGVSLSIAEGEILGVVGESGAGKSLTGAAIIGLLEPPGRISAGEVRFDGARIDTLPHEAMRRIRGRQIGAIFQDPLTTLNPLYTVGRQLVETMQTHLRLSDAEARARAAGWLEQVGIPAAKERLGAYPHEFSGGMRQRVVIALALCAEPRLVIADEPTTALDVSIQAQIIALLRRLTRDHGTSVMLVTHDMGVIAETADRVAVMYAGRVIEVGPVRDVIRQPAHPYTEGLMGSIPSLETRVARLRQIDGAMPRLNAIPRGCAYHPRCGLAIDRCRADRPELMPARATEAACWVRAAARFDVSKPMLQRLLSGEGRRTLRAVDEVSFAIPRGRTLSLVGESGCGKSTMARLAVGLYAPSAGSIRFDGQSLSAARAQPALRRRMNMIFQDPYASLNPRWRVRDIVAELPRRHRRARRATADAGRAVAEGWREISPRLQRRAAPAHLHRPRPVQRVGFPGLRRTDQCAGRLRAGADPEPDEGSAGADAPDLSVHQP